MRVTYLVDNKVTVAFAFAMCIWSVFFLEFWKRRQVRKLECACERGYACARESANARECVCLE